ncbi:MAG TPA: rhodanese-like domain-containing protein [Gemmatimonadaceae bacterium]
MFLRRFYDDQLAQASYMIGCTDSGTAVVVDANRDAEQYVAAAAAERVRITHVTETHIHADFVSGSLELARATGARLYLSDEGAPDWRYAFADREGAVALRDGATLEVGRVRLDALHTPGHTPEHLTFLVTDTASADQPMGALTGDFVFVGDVGRPDLLERAAGVAGTMEAGARQLFRSLARLATYPDFLQLWPGHGSGSACGKALGAVPQTTLGYERLFNWAFAVPDEDEFVRMVLAGQPEPPRYFATMKRVNRDGPAVLGGARRPERLAASRLAPVLADGALVVDTRHAADFAAGHVPGTINVPLDASFTTWAGWLIPYDRPVYLIVDEDEDGARTARATRDLAMIGIDHVAGHFGADAMTAWSAEGRPLERVPQITPAELRERMARGDVAVIDVRGLSEWEAGHIPGARHVPLGHLTDRLAELPAGVPLVMQCKGGGRSAIAASLLLARGRRDVMNLVGGYEGMLRNGE